MRLPGDDELVAYLDGEVETGRGGEIAHLLEISPVLRDRMAAIRHDAQVCSRVLADAQPEMPLGDRLWAALQARLEAEPAVAPPAGFWEWVRHGSVASRLMAATATACALFAAALWLGTPPVLSAHDVLLRARQAEAAHLKGVAVPVVHRRLRIVRSRHALREAAATLDSWTVAASGQSRLRLELDGGAALDVAGPDGLAGGDVVWADLSRVLTANHIDRRRLLSPSLYLQWRETVHMASERVVHRKLDDGSDGYAIAAVFDRSAGDGDIVRSDFVVRSRDWEPVTHRLQVKTAGGETDFEISVVESAVVARASLPAGYFDLPPSVVAANVTAPLARPAPAAVAIDPPPAPLAVPVAVETEIEALYAIHRAGACDGDPVALIAERDGRLAVKGTVSSPERRDRIVGMLADVPGVLVSLEVNEHPALAERPGAAPLRRLLRAAAPAGPRKTAAEVEAVELSAGSFLALIVSDGEALGGIAARFTAERTAALPARARTQLREMLQEHLAALEGNMRQVTVLLHGVAGAETGAAAIPGTPAEAAGWSEMARDLAAAVGRLSASGGADGDEPAAVAVRALARSCLRLSERAQQTRAVATRALADAPETLPALARQP
jgi:hypothetical protein